MFHNSYDTVKAAQLRADIRRAYDIREKSVGAESMRQLERRMLLSVLDDHWTRHLANLDLLKVTLAESGENNKIDLADYQNLADYLFDRAQSRVREDILNYLFKAET